MADPDTPMGGLDEPILPGYVPPQDDFPDEANWTAPTYISPAGENYLRENWMKSERQWKNRVGKGWVAKKVLGQGGFGVVGHWEYQGPDRAMKPLKDIAVKQAPARRKSRKTNEWTGAGLEKEAQFLMLFAGRRTQHIVRMYRHMYKDTGSGPGSVPADPATEVHRIFLEYCPGGDLAGYARDVTKLESQNRTRKLSELELWMIFHCLSRAVLVMHQGSEDTNKNAVRWNQEEILHCDLKLDNVLVGAKTTDAEHVDAPVFKIADFGISSFVPQIQDNNFLINSKLEGGTPVWNLPEQIPNVDGKGQYSRPWQDPDPKKNKVTDRRFGTASNVWQIGIIMHCLLNRKEYPEWDTMRPYKSTLSDFLLMKTWTIGCREDLEEENKYFDDGAKPVYSKWLRSLIAETLIVNPKDRHEVKSLVIATREGLEATRVTYKTQDIPMPDIASYDEPMLDPVWYSGQPNHPFYKAAQDAKNAASNVTFATPVDMDAREEARRAAEAAALNAEIVRQRLAKEKADREQLAKEEAARKKRAIEEAVKKKRAAAWLLPPTSTKPIDVRFIIERKSGFWGGRPPAENYTMVGISPFMRISEVRLNLSRQWKIPARKLVIRGLGHEAENVEYIGTVTSSSKIIRCQELP